VIQRNVLENPGWYTAYTPYQAEISQGRLEALLIFQTMVADLTGLPLANASLLDEATAAAEAMTCATASGDQVEGGRASSSTPTLPSPDPRRGRDPGRAAGDRGRVGRPRQRIGSTRASFGALLQYPGSSGRCATDRAAPSSGLHERRRAGRRGHRPAGAARCSTPPGELGADVAVGSAQRFGVPMGFGGPHAAFLATRDEYARHAGALIGVSVDATGTGLRMALQTREQHIRREKATSNICTAQVLLAVIAAMYAVYHGPDGLARSPGGCTADRRKSRAKGSAGCGVEVATTPSSTPSPCAASAGRRRLARPARARSGINLRVVDADHVGDRLRRDDRGADVAALLLAWPDARRSSLARRARRAAAGRSLNPAARAAPAFLTHPVFHLPQRDRDAALPAALQAKDLALDRSMIPLGSCTMKLNATTEMMPITWPEFAGLHPFAPPSRPRATGSCSPSSRAWLAEITGFDAVSRCSPTPAPGRATPGCWRSAPTTGPRRGAARRLPDPGVGARHQPGLGGDGRHAGGGGGLRRRRQRRRRRPRPPRPRQHADRLAALMVTYPSTHGVFEERIARSARSSTPRRPGLPRRRQPQRPGRPRAARRLGADVCHLNLHKTFCIPHGGGGPGVGPGRCVRRTWRPSCRPPAGRRGSPRRADRPAAAAPWGSAPRSCRSPGPTSR
jgi:glycine dehydrogenase